MPGVVPMSAFGERHAARRSPSCVAWATGRLPKGMFSGTRPLVVIDVEVLVDAKPKHAIAGGGDDVVVRIGLELAVAGVELFALGAFDDQEAVALDGHVERVGADLDRALA